MEFLKVKFLLPKNILSAHWAHNIVLELTAGPHLRLPGNWDLYAHMCVVLGARKFLDEAKQPSGLLWDLASLWRKAQLGPLPGNNLAAGETFLLNRHSISEETRPLLGPHLSCSDTVNRQLIWQDVEAFTASWKCSKQIYLQSKLISVLK